jgi:hypothetical protein
MTVRTADQTVEIAPFSRQIEGEEAIIGRPETGVFFSLPLEALEIVDALVDGRTIGEARDAFAARHGETPDMDDLLAHLQAHGLVRLAGGSSATETVFRGQFEWIPQSLAKALFGPPAMAVYAVSIVAAATAVITNPDLLPGWRAAYFPRNTAMMILALMLLGMVTTFLHELGHVLAARAQGVATRFGISNRLWFVVWETDMTGVWALPRRQRYLPILAGPMVDLLSASALILFTWAAQQGWIAPSPRTLLIIRGLLFIYLMRLLWQAYFFVRTDYYYAMTNALGCRSLMVDTEAFLRERWSRLRGRATGNTLERLPPGEQRAVRVYSIVWLLGRLVALSVLLFIQLPLFFNYLRLLIVRITTGGGDSGSMGWLPVVMFLLFFGAGMMMWIRSLVRGDRQDRMLARLPPGERPEDQSALKNFNRRSETAGDVT